MGAPLVRALLRAAGMSRYRPLLALARGGMATVDVALHDDAVGTRRYVVLKRVRADRDSGDGRELLASEARLSARLAHPNVVRTLDLEDDGDGDLTLVLEYVPGVTLGQVCRRARERRERVPLSIALRVVRDLLEGLAYVHSARDYDGAHLGVIHRDVSPSNVLVGASGVTKLIDFGVAKWAAATACTASGFVKGKISYMSPEQLVGAPLDPRADLFAVGVILWELVAGERIAQGERCERWIRARVGDRAPRLSDHAPHAPSPLAWVVERCLARDPASRYPDARAFADALDAIANAYGSEATHADVRAYVAARFADALHARAAELDERATKLDARPSAPTLPSAAPLPAPSSSSISVPPVTLTEPRAAPRSRAVERLAVVTSVAVAVAAAALTTATTVTASRPRPSAARARAAPAHLTTEPRSREGAEPATGAWIAAPAPTPLASAAPRAARPPAAPPPPAVSVAAAPPAGSDEVSVGWVTIDSYPWARVTVDGREVGVTPVVRLALAPGRHTVTLESPATGARRVEVVEVGEGEVVSRRFGGW